MTSRRRITVRTDIVGRDQGGFVKEAQEKFDATIKLHVPNGYRVGWLALFENLERAKQHFLIVIPLATVIVWGLFSSTLLTLFIVPVLYNLFAPACPASVTTTETDDGWPAPTNGQGVAC